MNESFLDIAIEAAFKGGEVLKKYWGSLSHIWNKSTEGDLVTEADKESEKVVLDHISKCCPKHEILSEESGLHTAQNQDYLWIVDPLDGTTNYTHQFPMVSVSIALYHKNKPLVGVVYNPILNELFQSEKGEGAYLNQNPIHVSHVNLLEKSLLATGFAYDRRDTKDNNYAEFCHLTNSCQGVRRAGSAALDICYVACGRLDGHWEIGLRPWDVAAGALMVEEAGGKVSGFQDEEFDIYSGVILATNGEIHDEIRHELMSVRNRL